MLLLFLWLYLRRKPRKRIRINVKTKQRANTSKCGRNAYSPARAAYTQLYTQNLYYAQQQQIYAAQQKAYERQQKQLERERKQAERERAQDAKRAAQIKQAEIDIPFFESQLDDYMTLHRDTQKLLDAAQKEVDTDNALNKYGAVVSIKILSNHIAARDRYKKQVLMYERQIHAAQKNLDKAKRVLDNG